MPERYVLVLAGGRGERFWPWSRPERPKQLLPLARDGRTLLATTLGRAVRLAPPERCLVLTSVDLVDSVRSECPAGVRVFGEPVGRNTGPAIGAAACLIERESPGSAFAVLPADHAIDDETAFAADLSRGLEIAERDRVLLTFGIRPTGPATSFGYIRRGPMVAERVFRVAAFTEKPELEKAQRFLDTGEYLWNAGIFTWRADALWSALEAARPALAEALRPLRQAAPADFQAALERVLPGCESISVDYAVLEQAPNVVVIEASYDWDDLGSWGAWARRQPRDERGNVVFGQAVVLDCDGCVVVGEGGTAAAVGLKDMVVVNAGGATLACSLERSEDVRRVHSALRERSPS